MTSVSIQATVTSSTFAKPTQQMDLKMNQFDDLMIDIETMGTAADSALVQIGAVFFNIPRRALGPTFLQTIHLATAVRDGGKIDPGTVLWWLGQGDAARKGIRFGGRDIRVVLQEFSDWIKETCRHEDVRVWGNSPTMDCTIPRTAYERAGMEVPWYWSHERDFRTVRNMNPKVEYNTDDKGDDAHNALVDAVFQAKHLFKIADYRSGKRA